MWMWGTADKPATKGYRIIVSDFIGGYLRQSSEELKAATSTGIDFPYEVRVVQPEKVYEADRDSFQNTSTTHQCTVVFWSEPLPADALNVNNMNVKPVGAQAVLYGEGRIKQTLIDSNGISKGMKQILKEHGINTDTLKGPDTRIIRMRITFTPYTYTYPSVY